MSADNNKCDLNELEKGHETLFFFLKKRVIAVKDVWYQHWREAWSYSTMGRCDKALVNHVTSAAHFTAIIF